MCFAVKGSSDKKDCFPSGTSGRTKYRVVLTSPLGGCLFPRKEVILKCRELKHGVQAEPERGQVLIEAKSLQGSETLQLWPV